MQESTTLQKLSRKVSEMLRTYDELRMQNAQLQEQIERTLVHRGGDEGARGGAGRGSGGKGHRRPTYRSDTGATGYRRCP